MNNRPLHSFFGVIMGICTISAIAILLSIWNASHRIRDRDRIDEILTILKKEDLSKYEKDEKILKLETQLEQKDFQQELILNQIGVHSDWVIFYVTILFSLVVIIEYASFKTRIDKIVEEHKEKQIENGEHFKKLKDELKLSEIDNLDAFVNIAQFQALYYRDKNRMLVIKHIENNPLVDSDGKEMPGNKKGIFQMSEGWKIFWAGAILTIIIYLLSRQ